MIDTHAHLTWHTFEGRVDEVISRAREAGIIGIVDVGTDIKSSLGARDHADLYENLWFAAGIHPSDSGTAEPADLKTVEELTAHPKCVAVGEIGLDYYRDYSPHEVQDEWFRNQLRLAKRIGKPVIIHDRKASEDILKVLSEEDYDGINGPGGVFHCFAGDTKMAEEVVRRGFYVSFTGNITYKKSDRPEVAKGIPLDRIMLETDCPFMAPVPKRGKENEPCFIPYVAAGIASAKSLTLEEIAKTSTENAIKLFNLNII